LQEQWTMITLVIQATGRFIYSSRCRIVAVKKTSELWLQLQGAWPYAVRRPAKQRQGAESRTGIQAHDFHPGASRMGLKPERTGKP
jgi:hypothetical protein